MAYRHSYFSDPTELSREDWLKERSIREEDVFEDDEGQYYVDVVDMENGEAGGFYENKVYLPENI